MKLLSVLPWVAASSAFVLPPEEVLGDLAIEDHHDHKADGWYQDAMNVKDDVVDTFKDYYYDVVESSENAWEEVSYRTKSALDQAFDQAEETAGAFSDKLHDAASDVQSWFEDESEELDGRHGGHHGHHGRRPHHPPHHELNETLWQLISGSKYTTRLAKIIGEYDDLVEALNSTKANHTIFAPIDSAFDKIPEHGHKPSKEQVKDILSYHIIPDVYPAGRVLLSHTAPTLFKSEHLGTKPQPQRLTFKLTFRGLTVNYYSRIVAINIIGTNGVIHGVDSILVPPPSALKIVDLFPGAFSTLELGLTKTGLLDEFKDAERVGGTFFFPTNSAFELLGPRINAFLFSQYGLKYLKALLQYHVVAGSTLYSDAFYEAESDSDKQDIPKGLFHVDLPTLLKDRSLSIDVARFGGFITIKINGFTRVAVSDNVADDGVIHVLRNVLIPPKQLGGGNVEQRDGYSELTEEDLMERLEPFVGKSDL